MKSTESGVFQPLIGHDGAKAILRSALRRADVHLLLSGPPASGKSVALLAIEEAIDGAKYVDARGFTERKLRDTLAQNPPVLLIDEFDNMKQDAFKALNTALEQGRVTKNVTHDSYDKEIDTQMFAACNFPEELPGDVADRFVGVDFDPYSREEYLDVCEVLLPKQIEWVADTPNPNVTAREIARVVWDQTDSRSPRTARDAAMLASAPERVPAIVRAMNDPKADVDSEPVHADKLPHNQREDDDPHHKPTSLDEVRENMAETEDLGDKDVDEVLQMLDQSGGDDGSDSGDDDSTNEAAESMDVDADTNDSVDRDGVSKDDFAGPIEVIQGDAGKPYFVTKGGPRADGNGPFQEDPALQFIERMVETDNRVSFNGYEAAIMEIIVLRSSVEEVRNLIQEWDINPQGPRTPVSPPSVKEERPQVAEGLAAFHFKLSSDELTSSGYDIENIIDALQTSDEPYLVTLSPKADAIIEDPSVFEM